MSRFTKFFAMTLIALGTGLASCTHDEFNEIEMENTDISLPVPSEDSDNKGGEQCPGNC